MVRLNSAPESYVPTDEINSILFQKTVDSALPRLLGLKHDVRLRHLCHDTVDRRVMVV